MNLSPPSPEVLAQLRAQYSYRYPQQATLTVPGDRGAPVKLVMVVGNPTGSCEMPDGEAKSTAWSETIAASLRPSIAIAGRIAQDCLLYPDLKTWGAWVARWPALPTRLLSEVIAEKITGLTVDRPALEEDPPPALAALLEKNPAAAWVRLKRDDEDAFAMAVNPPADHVFKAYHNDREKPGADRWQLMKDLVSAQVPEGGCIRLSDGEPCSMGSLIARWPALAVFVSVEIDRLAGRLADAELGE